MPRSTRGSRSLEKAERRAIGLQSIDPQLDFSNGLSLSAYNASIQSLRLKLNAYNAVIATLDRAQKEILLAEEELNDLTEHMLLGVAVAYGKNSNEYAMAGGVRKRARRRAVRSNVAPFVSFQQPSEVAPANSTNGKY